MMPNTALEPTRIIAFRRARMFMAVSSHGSRGSAFGR